MALELSDLLMGAVAIAMLVVGIVSAVWPKRVHNRLLEYSQRSQKPYPFQDEIESPEYVRVLRLGGFGGTVIALILLYGLLR